VTTDSLCVSDAADSNSVEASRASSEDSRPSCFALLSEYAGVSSSLLGSRSELRRLFSLAVNDAVLSDVNGNGGWLGELLGDLERLFLDELIFVTDSIFERNALRAR
jgi:hypothetical protein